MATRGSEERDRDRGRERILVVCTRYIGDTVLAIPFLRNLRRAFPDAVIDICAEGPARGVLADCPYVDDLVSWTRPGRRGPVAALTAIRTQAAWLAGRRYTRAYLLKRSLSAGLLVTLAGIPVRVGLAGDGRWLLTRAVTAPRGRHQAARYLDLLSAEGIDVDDGHSENWVAPATAARVSQLVARLPAGRPRVFLAAQTTAPERHWPADRWEAVIEWLVLARGCEVIFCGGPTDVVEHNRLRAAVGPDVADHVHDFTAELSLRETGGLVARMDACLGVDTGLVHLAASHGVPVAVLVGPTDPNQWSPWTARAVVVRSARVRRPLADRLPVRIAPPTTAWPFGEAAMDDIAVEDVVVAISAMLPDPVPAPAAVAARTAMRSLDLRQGSFRYEVLDIDAAASPSAAVPVAG